MDKNYNSKSFGVAFKIFNTCIYLAFIMANTYKLSGIINLLPNLSLSFLGHQDFVTIRISWLIISFGLSIRLYKPITNQE